MSDITTERLELCKKYMIIDHDEDDMLISSLMAAADAYLEGAGVSREVDSFLYDAIANDMVLRMYDGRDDDIEHAATSQIARQMLTQLKLKCAYGGGASVN